MFVVDLFCKISPAIGATVFVAIALLSIAAWRGGNIDEVNVPGLIKIKLDKPLRFGGSKIFLAISAFSFVCAVAIGSLQLTSACARCDGLPGETAWIFGGTLNYAGGFTTGPFVKAEQGGVSPERVAPGMWIILEEPRKTMIMGYDKTDIARAMDSPFSGPRVTYTCKLLAKGQRLFVAAREIRGPNPNEQHIWYRVRLTQIGG